MPWPATSVKAWIWRSRLRVAALGITAVILVFLNPNWDVIWYLGLLLCLVLVGLAQRRVGQVGQSRAELGLLFLDLLLNQVVHLKRLE